MRLRPGESARLTFRSTGATDQHVRATVFEPEGGWNIFVMGWIDVDDELGVRRRLSFCRVFDQKLQRFVPVDNPDYESGE